MAQNRSSSCLPLAPARAPAVAARDLLGPNDERRMESLSTDAELIARSVDEPARFAGLYERHGLAVRRYVRRRVGDAAGDDLASEVFVHAFRARSRYWAERHGALPWLLGIANHVIADHRRIEHRRLKALAQLTGEVPGLVEHEDSGLAPELVAALRRLPAVERDTLLLVGWGEITQDEAAVALGVPVGTVSSRITRARRRLAAELRPAPPAMVSEFRLTGETNA
jgi:RNA polymerase sigma factor (sigma-70 family)